MLAWIERPKSTADPVLALLYRGGRLRQCLAAIGVSAAPTQVDEFGNAIRISAESLLSANNIQRLLVDMPGHLTFIHSATSWSLCWERGLLNARAVFLSDVRSRQPRQKFAAGGSLDRVVGNSAADAAYVVLIPLAGVISPQPMPPIAIAAAFAGVSGGFPLTCCRTAMLCCLASPGSGRDCSARLGCQHCG